MDFGNLSTYFNLAVGAAASGVGIAAVAKTFFTVSPKETALVTRFGKLIRAEETQGLHVKIPFVDKIDKRIGMDVQQTNENLTIKTSDDLFVDLPIAIQFEVNDAEKYHYGNRAPIDNLKKSVAKAVKTQTSGKEFSHLFSDRDEINDAVVEHIAAEAAEYGIRVKRIIIDEPKLPQEIENSYNERRASERAIETAKNRATAHATEVVQKAEADAKAQALAGKGAADFRAALFSGYEDQIKSLTTGEGAATREEAVSMVMHAMTLDAMRDVASSGNLIVVPQNFTGGDLAQVKTLQGMAPKAA